MKILHLSDLHIGADQNDTALLRIMEHINTRYGWDVPIVITGDVVDTPTPANYKRAQDLLQRIAAHPLFIVPGNHDYYPMGIDPGGWYDPPGASLWGRFIEPLCQQTRHRRPYVWRHQALNIIGLDTMAGTAGDWRADTAAGSVGGAQLHRLTTLLQDSPTIVIGHHRVHWRDVWHRMRDAGDLAQIMEPRALAYLCGHQHQEAIVEGNGTIYIASHRTTQSPLRYSEITIGATVEQRDIWVDQ